MKKVDLDSEYGVPTTTIREVATLRDLQHSNVVSLLDVIVE